MISTANTKWVFSSQVKDSHEINSHVFHTVTFAGNTWGEFLPPLCPAGLLQIFGPSCVAPALIFVAHMREFSQSHNQQETICILNIFIFLSQFFFLCCPLNIYLSSNAKKKKKVWQFLSFKSSCWGGNNWSMTRKKSAYAAPTRNL